MKRIVLLVVALSLIVSCQRSNYGDPKSLSKLDTAQPQSETSATQIGSAELMVKTELKGVKTMALASGINSLLVSDGTILGEGVDLEILSLAD